MSLGQTLLLLVLFTAAYNAAGQGRNANNSCPLDFSILRNLLASSGQSQPTDLRTRCQYMLQGLRLVDSNLLRRTGEFLPPLASADSCWDAYQSVVNEFIPDFRIRSSCGFKTDWIAQGCMNITTREGFEALIPNRTINGVVSRCNQSLESNSPCASCTSSFADFQAYLTGDSIGNVSDCTAFPSIYAAAFGNIYGPTDKGTAKCLFQLNFYPPDSNNKKKGIVAIVVVATVIGFGVLAAGSWYCWRRNESRRRRKRNRDKINDAEIGLRATRLESISESTNLVKFTFDEIKKATSNFARDNIIGKGGYGNVYRGVLPDGSEVAFKRFKNCSVGGDINFAHEVEVIASIRHVNLVALRGYCIATTAMEGHQRIIVCDIVKNGSLHDHLFGRSESNLSWPIRQKIAVGTARGIAYLHSGAQPAIIHRDIKASNILLDEQFEAKVADFGLAKFNPEGMTHMSTRVAGTMGYVAPEYAMYGQLTESSDVYSFGVVLLELLSRKKALVINDENQPCPVTDWAWSLVRQGKALDVVEGDMPELGPAEVMEKYVLVAVLCTHPQRYARPTMDQVVKLLETDLSVPSLPDRPISLVSDISDIERSVSSSGSGQLLSPTGYQPYTLGADHSSGSKEEERN